jgi:hypothetical protein
VLAPAVLDHSLAVHEWELGVIVAAPGRVAQRELAQDAAPDRARARVRLPRRERDHCRHDFALMPELRRMHMPEPFLKDISFQSPGNKFGTKLGWKKINVVFGNSLAE